jgi:hypothetical protein
VADAQADYDHALAGLQDQANAAWDEYAQALQAGGCPPAGGPIQFVGITDDSISLPIQRSDIGFLASDRRTIPATRRSKDDLDKLNRMVRDAIARGDIAELTRLHALFSLIHDIYKVMDDTRIIEFLPGGCQRWIDKFEANLSGFRSPLVKERNVGWEPSRAIGGGPAYYYFLLHDGTLIVVDHWIYYGGSRLRIYLPANGSP